MIKGVLFDIDGVLIHSQEANIEYLIRMVKNLGLVQNPTAETFRGMHGNSIKQIILKIAPEKEHEIEALLEQSLKTEYPTHLAKLPEHSHETMEQLVKQYKVGLVSNRMRIGIERYFLISQNSHHFTAVIGSDDVSKAKPDPEGLLLACEHLGLPPAECVYVGDTDLDVQAGQAANMKVIIINAENVSGADSYIKSLDQIIPAIKNFDNA